jgi:histidinol-phosphatase (PHP family)
LIDYHLHVIAHGDRPMTVENILKYCEVAKARGVSQMGITEHDRYLEEIDLAAFQEARELSPDVGLRLGIEIDFVPGAEERMDKDATALPYDYVIGSVHRVDNEEVDRATDQRVYVRDITPILEETADAVAESGVVVDVNAAGLRKPVGEVYPAREFLEMFHKRGVPIVLSSDAHAPDEVAMGYDTSLALVHDVGYREVATFRNHEQGTLPI